MSTLTESQQKLRRRWLLLTKLHKPLIEEHQAYLVCKRGMDLLICMGLFPIAFCLMVIISIAIILDSRGSPFFIQERVGKDRRLFRMYKFRTLQHNYDNPEHRAFMQAFVLGERDLNTNSLNAKALKPPLHPYFTRVGRLLRKTSLDELPQIFNVLKGEMSLIGPRPNVTWEVEKYKDWHYERLKVLPGITGLAQVRGRSSISFDTIVQNDIEYIQHQSLRLDLHILWRTLRSVFGGYGAG